MIDTGEAVHLGCQYSEALALIAKGNADSLV